MNYEDLTPQQKETFNSVDFMLNSLLVKGRNDVIKLLAIKYSVRLQITDYSLRLMSGGMVRVWIYFSFPF